MYHIGIDLGGTNIAAGVADESNRLLFTESVPTGLPRPAGEIARAIHDLAAAMLAKHEISFRDIGSVGIGIPGSINKDTGAIEYANNFGFDNVPFLDMLKQYFDGPVYVENDGNAAAWGEYLAGAGMGSSSMVAVTLGTGVGGGIILNGKIFDGCNNAAGEIGHMVIERGGRPCTCGRSGCLEAYASATALGKRAGEAAAAEPDSLLHRFASDSGTINGKMVFDAVQLGDAAAAGVLAEYLDYLAEGIANIVNILQPELVCVGGGLSGAGELLLQPLDQKVRPLLYTRNSERNMKLILARLGNDAGIIGAAGLHWLYRPETGQSNRAEKGN